MRPTPPENTIISNDLTQIKDYIETIPSDEFIGNSGLLKSKERLFEMLKNIYYLWMRYHNQKVDVKSWPLMIWKDCFVIEFILNDSEPYEFYFDWWNIKSKFTAEKISKEAEKIFFKGMLSELNSEIAQIDHCISSVSGKINILVNWDS